MVYIDFIEIERELLNKKEIKCYNFVKKILIFFRKLFNYISISKTEYGELIKIQSLKVNTLKKLEKKIKINNVQIACLSKKINNNKEFDIFLKNNNVRKIDGRWMTPYLLVQLIDYISENKEEKIFQQEVSLLVNKNNYLINKIIYKIAKECKNVNIITTKRDQFKNLENRIFEEDGILLNIGNNYKKSLLNSNIIINVDFSEEQINKYNIPKYCCIINIEKDISINRKSFEGINIHLIKYIINKEFDFEFKNFEKNIIYESLISRNSNQDNVFNQIKKDNLKIVEIYGKNGVIRKKEFLKLKRLNIN